MVAEFASRAQGEYRPAVAEPTAGGEQIR